MFNLLESFRVVDCGVLIMVGHDLLVCLAS